jgi:hypothetical protein
MFRNKIYKIIDLLVSYLVNSAKAKSNTFSLIVAYFEISEADDIGLHLVYIVVRIFKSIWPVCAAVSIACWVYSPLTIVLISEGPIGLLMPMLVIVSFPIVLY